MKIMTLDSLYLNLLRDIHSCESQVIDLLPKMVKAADHSGLQSIFLDHLETSKEHLERLDLLFADLGKNVGNKVCAATDGLVKECEDLMEAEADAEVRDVGLICAAQRIEHYEIAMYGCLRTYATLVHRDGDVTLLEKCLSEEKASDKALTVLAMGVINKMPAVEKPEPVAVAATT